MIIEKDNTKETIKALENFKMAYFELLTECMTDVGEEIIHSSEKYPFDKMFYELDICEWVDDVIKLNKNKKCKIIKIGG